MVRQEKDNNEYYSHGNLFSRALKLPLMYLAWTAPHKRLRVWFHKCRGVHIGKNVEIGYFAMIGNVHPQAVYIGDNAVVTANVTILDHDNSYYYTGRGDVKIGEVHIGRNAFVGIGSVVMPGVNIGDNAIVGALSFVNKSIPDNAIAGGNPARIIKITA